jgi:vacuolar-type H+-ATPase subunit I/STV1
MPVMLERWNDDRMDALAGRVDDLDERMEKGFARVDAALGDLRQELRDGFAQVDKRFERMDERFERMAERMDERFERLHRLLFQASVVTIAALIGLIAAGQW